MVKPSIIRNLGWELVHAHLRAFSVFKDDDFCLAEQWQQGEEAHVDISESQLLKY